MSCDGPDGTEQAATASTPALRPVPEGPVWVNFEGRGQSDRPATRLVYRQPVWLSPLPSAGSLTLRASWPAYGIDDASITVDSATLADAASGAQPFWPDQ